MIIYELSENAIAPIRSGKQEAGIDLFTPYDFSLETGEIRTVGTGVRVNIGENRVALLRGRSGLATKGIDPLEFCDPEKAVVLGGVIDSTYRGEIGIILKNLGSSRVDFNRGDRICQIVILPIITDDLMAGKVGSSERGERGFGSSGR